MPIDGSLALSRWHPGGGYPYTPYISSEQWVVGLMATTHMVLWAPFYRSHGTRKQTTTQPDFAVAPYDLWACRGMLEISPAGYRWFG